jgi:hypothetical protein
MGKVTIEADIMNWVKVLLVVESLQLLHNEESCWAKELTSES